MSEIAVRKGGFVGLRGRVSRASTRTVAGAGKGVAFLEVSFRMAGYDVVSRVVGDVLVAAEGDEMIVSGYVQGGVVAPVAWWNCAKGAGYSPSTWGYRPTVIALIMVATLALWLVLAKHATLVQVLVLVLPALILGGVAYTDYTRSRCAEWVTRTLHGQSPD